MPTILDYKIKITKLQHFKEYIETNLPTFTVNYIVTNIYSGNNYVSIEFNESLTETNINTINTSISSYTDDTSAFLDYIVSFSVDHSRFTNLEYTSLSQFSYRPMSGNLTKMSVTSMKNSLDNYTYSLRVVDITNKIIIGTLTGLSNTDYTKDTINLSNLPNSDSIFELQGKLDSSNNFGAFMHAYELLYYQV